MVAPDYPGFRHSDWPDPKKFAYTFDHYAEIMNHFSEALGLSRYTLYMQDYGGPVGFRMAFIEGLGGELETAAGLLGRLRRQRKHASHRISGPMNSTF
jgi:hypothetical protein